MNPNNLQACIAAFESQVQQLLQSLVDSGLDKSTAEYELLCRLCMNEMKTDVDDGVIDTYIIRGCMKREDALRAVVIEKELVQLQSEGFSMAKAVHELTLRISEPVPISISKSTSSVSAVKESVSLSKQRKLRSSRSRDINNHEEGPFNRKLKKKEQIDSEMDSRTLKRRKPTQKKQFP